MTIISDIVSKDDEQRLRELAHGVAKGIEPGETILKRLGFTMEDYLLLSESSTFKTMLRQAEGEWQGAVNTQKRIKLKAAVNIEEGLPSMYQAMVSMKEPLAARVKVFETMARIAGVGNPEPMSQGPTQSFRLEINLAAGGGGERQIIIEGAQVTPEVTPPALVPSADSGESTLPLNSNDELTAGMEGWEE